MKEWYLTIPSPDITSGFESDAISEYAQNNFLDVLETDFCNHVLLYNHDLTESKEIRCVIQNNIADTQLKSMERTVLAPIGLLHSGDYIFFEDEYWIVDGRPGNNKSYEKATLKECQYKIKWQKDDGSVIERWANLTSASKYDIGESGNNTIFLSSNNFTIVIPHDADGLTIDEKRVFIDTSDNPQKVFKITRNDDALFFHGSNGGTLSLIADKTELNVDTDRPDLGLCDYIEIKDSMPEQPNLSVKISGNSTLLLGVERCYVASIIAENGNSLNWDSNVYLWNVISDVEIQKEENGNKITLLVNDIPNEDIILQVVSNDIVLAEMSISVSEMV